MRRTDRRRDRDRSSRRMGAGFDPRLLEMKISDQEYAMVNTFKNHKPGRKVPGDGNCGLHSLCQVLYDDRVAATPSVMLYCIFFIFELHDYPDYWWSDEELAVIADYFGYDTYIYNQANHTGIVFGRGDRSPMVLYSVESNTHWMPGTRARRPSDSYIPIQFTVIENVTDVLTIGQINERLKRYLSNGGRSRRSRRSSLVDAARGRSLGAKIKTAVMDKLDKVCTWANCGDTGYSKILKQSETMARGGSMGRIMLRNAENMARSLLTGFCIGNKKKRGGRDRAALSLIPIGPCSSDTETGSDREQHYEHDDGQVDRDGSSSNEADVDEPVESESDVEVVYGRADEGRVYVRKRAVPLPSTSDSDEDLVGAERETLCNGQHSPSASSYE